ncbi:NAD(P)-binding protein [Fomes fomentarius]|nr:NAD(P)-binding protein [Fomes fomentarius]
MATDKPLALVFGATGATGKSIINGLLDTAHFRIAAVIRPASLSKPEVEKLRSSGVEIRTGDLNDGVEALKKLFKGVSVIISAVVALAISQQKDAILAAKAVGVQRFVPCDFGTPGAKGVRRLHDSKLEIREFIKEVGVPYTIIDVGWWMQFYLPVPLRSKLAESVKKMNYSIAGEGDSRNLLTDRDRIGVYVARIVADPRTLNNSVIVWEDEITRRDALELGERLSGEGDKLKAQRIYVTAEDLKKNVAAGVEAFMKDPNDWGAHVTMAWNEYQHSMHILEENTLENAKKLGYLDVRELYPEIVPLSFEEYAKKFYSLEDAGTEVYQW